MKNIITFVALSILWSNVFGQSAKEAYPKFSWDKIPVYIHFGKNDGLTDDEIKFVATHSDFVCFEKGHGANVHGSTLFLYLLLMGIQASAWLARLVPGI